MINMQTVVAEVLEAYLPEPRQDAVLEKLSAFLDMVRGRQREVNITDIRDPNDLAVQVVGDALAPLAVAPEDFPVDGPSKLLDVGTGAGLPGLVYAIYWPQTEVVLLDSQKKRIDFVREVVEELGLPNVEVLEGRAESHAHALEWREQFDVVTSRALAPLPISLELCLPFLELEGYFLTYKNLNPNDEIKEAEFALGKLGGGPIVSRAYTPGAGAQKRSALFIPKVGLTPDKYPRREGIPAKRPLRASR